MNKHMVARSIDEATKRWNPRRIAPLKAGVPTRKNLSKGTCRTIVNVMKAALAQHPEIKYLATMPEKLAFVRNVLQETPEMIMAPGVSGITTRAMEITLSHTAERRRQRRLQKKNTRTNNFR